MTLHGGRCLGLIVAALGLAAGTPAYADDVFGGVYVHDAGLGTNLIGGRPRIEHGVDFLAGWRGGPILPVLGGPQPHLLASINTAGGTDFAAAGISWKIGTRFYFRPGIGLAVHTGNIHPSAFPTNRRLAFGSRVLFEPEGALGVQIAPKMSLEASWIHFSHADLLGHPNPGIDLAGLRLNIAFP